MNFSEMLNALVAESGKSKNQIIQKAGIDRSSFFQALRGSRRLTIRQLQGIIAAIEPDDKERINSLFEAWQLEKLGPEAFGIRQAVRRNISLMDSAIPALSEKSGKTGFVKYIMDYMNRIEQRTAADAPLKLDFFISANMMLEMNIFRMLLEFVEEAGRKISARIVINEFADREATDERFVRIFTESVQLHFDPRIELFCYWRETKVREDDISLFGYPFYILSSFSMLHINDPGSDIVLSEDQIIVRTFRKKFAGALEKSLLMSHKVNNMAEEIGRMEKLTSGFHVEGGQALRESEGGSERSYVLQYRPCCLKYATDGMLYTYAPAEIADMVVNYVHAMKSMDMHIYIDPAGLKAFEQDHRFKEAGYDFQLTDEDAESLLQMFSEARGKTLFMTNPDRIRISQDWDIFSSPRTLLVQNTYRPEIIVTSEDGRLCRIFYDYLSHMEEDNAAEW